MTPQFNEKYSWAYGWAGLAVVALVFLGVSWGTALHRFAVGLMMSMIVLFVLVALLEGLRWAAVCALRRLGFAIEC